MLRLAHPTQPEHQGHLAVRRSAPNRTPRAAVAATIAVFCRASGSVWGASWSEQGMPAASTAKNAARQAVYRPTPASLACPPFSPRHLSRGQDAGACAARSRISWRSSGAPVSGASQEFFMATISDFMPDRVHWRNGNAQSGEPPRWLPAPLRPDERPRFTRMILRAGTAVQAVRLSPPGGLTRFPAATRRCLMSLQATRA